LVSILDHEQETLVEKNQAALMSYLAGAAGIPSNFLPLFASFCGAYIAASLFIDHGHVTVGQGLGPRWRQGLGKIAVLHQRISPEGCYV